MENSNMGKLVCETIILGEEMLVAITTAPQTNIGSFVKLRPGVGKPFWYWPSAVTVNMASCDFTNAPIVTNDTSTNNALVAGITTLPEDVITYNED